MRNENSVITLINQNPNEVRVTSILHLISFTIGLFNFPWRELIWPWILTNSISCKQRSSKLLSAHHTTKNAMRWSFQKSVSPEFARLNTELSYWASRLFTYEQSYFSFVRGILLLQKKKKRKKEKKGALPTKGFPNRGILLWFFMHSIVRVANGYPPILNKVWIWNLISVPGIGYGSKYRCGSLYVPTRRPQSRMITSTY